MTDLEMTKLCAKAMGYSLRVLDSGDLWVDDGRIPQDGFVYYPLHEDDQAMALVKKFQPAICWDTKWCVDMTCTVDDPSMIVYHENLNRAIVECVAKMRATTVSDRSNPKTT